MQLWRLLLCSLGYFRRYVSRSRRDEKPLEVGRKSKRDFAVAGGAELEGIGSVEKSGAAVAVCGGSIYKATDPGDMARQLRAKINTLG